MTYARDHTASCADVTEVSTAADVNTTDQRPVVTAAGRDRSCSAICMTGRRRPTNVVRNLHKPHKIRLVVCWNDFGNSGWARIWSSAADKWSPR